MARLIAISSACTLRLFDERQLDLRDRDCRSSNFCRIRRIAKTNSPL
jgi:hypothetical protein